MKALRILLFQASLALALTWASAGQAQWLTQTNVLKAGWNAVYLHVDASHDTLTNLIAADAANPILEVWLWAPAPATLQFVQSPQQATDTGSQWVSWVRTNNAGSALQRLAGNAAYLVRVGTNVSTYDWLVKGKPLAPAYQWTSTGLNFLDFPTLPVNPPMFETFLAQAPALLQSLELYRYQGGELGATNPARLLALRTTPVTRGQAYWLRAGDLFNSYFGPFELSFAGSRGVDFGDSQGTFSFRVRNLVASNLSVSLRLVASEDPPAGQTAIAGEPPLLVRGRLNPTNLVYGYTNLPTGGLTSWTLAGQGQSGSEVEVVLGLNRSAITAATGSLLAGILRFTDSLGFCQVDVPLSALAGSRAGLWVGWAMASQVGEYLKSYAVSTNNTAQLLVSSNGAYVVSALNTNWGAVPRPFPLRLIVHNPESSGNAVLLQRVYYGLDATTNWIVARSEGRLHRDWLPQARRISATHLPWTATNGSWSFDGRLGQATNLAATVWLDYADQASNPFLHTYHPDHDNLNASFTSTLPQGSESYAIRREISLLVQPPADDFTSLTASGQTLTGSYLETLSLLGLARAGGANDTRQFQVRGGFSLTRIASVPVLAP